MIAGATRHISIWSAFPATPEDILSATHADTPATRERKN